MRIHVLAICVLAACASPSAVEIELAPSVISSLDGTTTLTALLVDDNATPTSGQAVHVAVAYTDRNGMTHDVPAIDGKTNDRGVFVTTLSDLTWEGTGTVTVTSGAKVTGAATFAVLDRTPPKVTILNPTTDLHVGPGLPVDVQVHAVDEIGIASVSFDTDAAGGGTTRILASGTTDTTLTFRITVPANQTGTIQLFALAQDLSGNRAAAVPLTLTIDPTISIATAPGLMGTLLTDGTATQLVNPRAIAMSSKDNLLYVADQAGTGVCNPSCVWQVDPSTGAVGATPVVVGLGEIEEVTFDATADNLYISDRQNRVVQLAWNGTNAYVTQTVCDNVAQNPPQDPYHLVVDATLGVLAVEGNNKEVVRLATCAPTTTAAAFSMNANFDSPRGIAAGAAGEFYVSDNNRGQVYKMTNAGALTTFETNVQGAYGMEWLGASATTFASSLMVAATGDRIVASTTGHGPLAAVYLRNGPIDLTIAAGTMYIVTTPGNTLRGRIYKVTGF